MSVSFDTLSAKLRFGIKGSSAVMEYKMASADVTTFLSEQFGVTTVPGVGYTITKRSQHSNWSWLWLEDVQVDPMMDDPPHDSSFNYPCGAKVTCTYTSLDLADGSRPDKPNYENGTYLTWETQAQHQIMTVPQSALRWESKTGSPVGADIHAGIIVPTIAHRLSWHYIYSPPWVAMRTKVGKVNAANWPSTSTSPFPAETLLFASYSTKHDYDTIGNLFFQVSYEFLERALPTVTNYVTWNMLYRSTHPLSEIQDGVVGWRKVVDADGNPPYMTTNFDDLFWQGL